MYIVFFYFEPAEICDLVFCQFKISSKSTHKSQLVYSDLVRNTLFLLFLHILIRLSTAAAFPVVERCEPRKTRHACVVLRRHFLADTGENNGLHKLESKRLHQHGSMELDKPTPILRPMARPGTPGNDQTPWQNSGRLG